MVKNSNTKIHKGKKVSLILFSLKPTTVDNFLCIFQLCYTHSNLRM